MGTHRVAKHPEMARPLPALPAPFDTLPDDVLRSALFRHLTDVETLALLKACFPRCMITTKSEQGRRVEYAFGVKAQGFGSCAAYGPCLLVRGCQYDVHADSVTDDWEAVHPRLRWVCVTARDATPIDVARLQTLSGTVEQWNHELVRLAFGVDRNRRGKLGSW